MAGQRSYCPCCCRAAASDAPWCHQPRLCWHLGAPPSHALLCDHWAQGALRPVAARLAALARAAPACQAAQQSACMAAASQRCSAAGARCHMAGTGTAATHLPPHSHAAPRQSVQGSTGACQGPELITHAPCNIPLPPAPPVCNHLAELGARHLGAAMAVPACSPRQRGSGAVHAGSRLRCAVHVLLILHPGKVQWSSHSHAAVKTRLLVLPAFETGGPLQL